MKVSAMILAGAAAMMIAGGAAAETLKFAYIADANEIGFARVMKPWVDGVNSAAGGKLTIVPYPSGALGRALPQQPQMVLDGVADIAWVVASASPGRFPDAAALELPGLYRSVEEATLVNNRVATSVPLAGMEKFKVLAAFGSPPLSVFTTDADCDLKSLHGKKLRVTTPSDGAVLARLGAVPVQIPITEVTEALGRRTIDGAVTHPQTLFDFGINRVTRCMDKAGLSSPLLLLLMNREKYDALPAEMRALLDSHSGETLARAFATAIAASTAEMEARLKATPGFALRPPEGADAATLQAAFTEARADLLAKNARAAGVLDAVEQARAQLPSQF